MKSYQFKLKAGKTLYLNMETTSMGWIKLNRFVPDYLQLGYGSPLIAGEQNNLEADEFETDCTRMVYCFNDNDLDYKNSQHCFAVFDAIIDWHIQQHGRIIFGDMMTYASEICELMSAMGYSVPVLKKLFPNFLAASVGSHGGNVKEAIPGGFGFAPQLVNFEGTARYHRLGEMCPRLTDIPKL